MKKVMPLQRNFTKRDRFTKKKKEKIKKVSKVNRLVDRHLKHLDVGTRRCVRILLSKSF